MHRKPPRIANVPCFSFVIFIKNNHVGCDLHVARVTGTAYQKDNNNMFSAGV